MGRRTLTITILAAASLGAGFAVHAHLNGASAPPPAPATFTKPEVNVTYAGGGKAPAPFPAEASQNLIPSQLTGVSCNKLPNLTLHSAPKKDWPTTPSQLAQRSPSIAVVAVVDQRSYWHRARTGGIPELQGWEPVTVTNLVTRQVAKGTVPDYFQFAQVGARVGSIPCADLTYEIPGEPVLDAGHTYVMFFAASNSVWGSIGRFDVINGVVHVEGDVHRGAWSMKVKPEPLAQFLNGLK